MHEVLHTTQDQFNMRLSRRDILALIASGLAISVLPFHTEMSGAANQSDIAYLPMTPEQEHQSIAQISRVYRATFGRDPDAEGLAFHATTYRDKHISIRNIISDGFMRSEEWQNTFGTLDSQAIVAKLYSNVLSREPDAEGLQFWLNELNSGVPLSEIILAISNSPENLIKTGTTLSGSEFYHPQDIEYADGIGGPRIIPDERMGALSYCESRNDPTAKNKRSSASGLYQFLDDSWETYQKLVLQDFPHLAHLYAETAREACEPLQHLVAYYALYGNVNGAGIQNWNESRSCWGPRISRSRVK